MRARRYVPNETLPHIVSQSPCTRKVSPIDEGAYCVAIPTSSSRAPCSSSAVWRSSVSFPAGRSDVPEAIRSRGSLRSGDADSFRDSSSVMVSSPSWRSRLPCGNRMPREYRAAGSDAMSSCSASGRENSEPGPSISARIAWMYSSRAQSMAALISGSVIMKPPLL